LEGEGLTKMRSTEVVLDNLGFPEDPRWHDGSLWFSDMDARVVMRWNPQGTLEEVVQVPGIPSGLGWTPEGKLLVVSMAERMLLEVVMGGASVRADLSDLASFHCNDMVVDDEGRAYIGTFGFDFAALSPFQPGQVLLVTPDGQARVAADSLSFPNGLAITPDKRTLLVGETLGERITAFDILADGSLARRRIWAELRGGAPDGISLDAEGALWVASPINGRVYRLAEGGAILDQVAVESQAYACRLGGPDGNTLFITTSYPLGSLFHLKSLPSPAIDETKVVPGRIEWVKVDVPGAGFP
jgi:sugar lactone lactonase YvrE